MIVNKEYKNQFLLGLSYATNKNVSPFTEYASLTFINNHVIVKTTNVKNDIEVRVPISNGSHSKKIYVIAADLQKALSNVNNGFELEVTADYLIVNFEKSRIKISYTTDITFPDRERSNAITCNLPANWLCENFAKALNFVGNDELRPVMQGVFVSIDDNVMDLAATDAHILFKTSREVACENVSAIINSDCRAITSLSNYASTINVTFCENNVIFETDNKDVCITASKLDGKYPPFKSVIPQQSDVSFSVDTKQLLTAIKTILPFGNATTSTIKLEGAGFELTCLSENIETNKSAYSSVDCSAPSTFAIGLNGRFFLNVLSCIKYHTAKVSFNGDTKPLVMNDDTNSVYLIMPVKL